jgi:hypothetical protein
MFEELQTWWQTQTPQTQTAVHAGGMALVGLLGGQFLATVVLRALRAKNFDAIMRLPRATSVPADAEHGFTPTMVGANLVRLTVWAGAIWWIARLYGQVEFAHKLTLIISRGWAFAGVLAAALTLGSLLARRLIECMQELTPQSPAGVAGRNGSGPAGRGVAGAAGAAAYVLVVLLSLLIAADLFDWPLTKSSAQALWSFAQHLLIAGAALGMGSLGARWARDLVTADAAASPGQRAAQYTGLGILAATTLLAVAVLLSGAGVLIGVAALAMLGVVPWLLRGYLPDISAGLQLRAHRVREVCFEGVTWQVSEIGFLTTQVTRQGEFYRVQNRLALDARLHGAPAKAAAGGATAAE